jgi:hypothetical protein
LSASTTSSGTFAAVEHVGKLPRRLLIDADRFHDVRRDCVADVGERLLELALEGLDHRTEARTQRLTGLVRGARDVAESQHRRIQVEAEQRVLQVLGLGAEQARGNGVLLHRVFDGLGLVEDHVERLVRLFATLRKHLAELVAVQTESLERGDARLTPALRNDGDLFERVGNGVRVACAAAQALRDEAQRLFAVDAELLELDAVLVERVEQVARLVGALLDAAGDDVECLVGAARHAGDQHLVHGAGDLGRVGLGQLAEGQQFLRDRLDRVVTGILRHEVVAEGVTDRVPGVLQALAEVVGVDLPGHLAQLGGVLGVAGLGGDLGTDRRPFDRGVEGLFEDSSRCRRDGQPRRHRAACRFRDGSEFLKGALDTAGRLLHAPSGVVIDADADADVISHRRRPPVPLVR